MLIKNENGYLEYTVDEDEIVLDKIVVVEKRKGTGRKLIKDLKSIASDLDKPINLYAYPQDDSITEEELREFYDSCGFVLSSDDIDGNSFTW